MRAALAILGLYVAATGTTPAATLLPATAEVLADAMQSPRVILLGEVHDNAKQHALRAAALRLLVERGARPAIAFEQFDREQQAAIDRARRERPGDPDFLISEARGAPSWRWDFYKPSRACTRVRSTDRGGEPVTVRRDVGRHRRFPPAA